MENGTTSELHALIESMPETEKKEVLGFVKYLSEKKNKKESKLPLKAGFLKGYYTMSEDFNEPLEEFKEYM